MKALLFALVISLATVVHAQQTMTNDDVIGLTKSGLSAEVIAAKIRQSGGSFDTSTAKLKELKSSGVAETVIVAMIEASSSKPHLNEPPERGDSKSLQLTLRDGTPVELELAYTVSSADLKEGDAVSFRVVQPIQVNGVTLIERGASATARVVKAEGGKSWGRGGNLTWAIQHVTTVDNQKVPLNYTTGSKGNGAPGTMTTGIILTSLVFWPAAPLWGFKKGKPAVIPAGKRFEVFVHGDAEISIDKEALQPATRNGKENIKVETATKPCYQNGRKVLCQ